MLEDGKLGTVLAAAAAVFVVFFLVFLLLFGWGFYVSSALGAVAAVTMIWWMGIEDAEMIDDQPGKGRTTSRPIAPSEHVGEDTAVGTTTPVEAEDVTGAASVTVAPLEHDAVAAAVPADAATEENKPALMETPDGAPDDLTRIKGVGPKLRDMLNGMGVWHFHQIAGWSDAELDWVDGKLEGFKGRARRDDWVGQAKDLS